MRNQEPRSAQLQLQLSLVFSLLDDSSGNVPTTMNSNNMDWGTPLSVQTTGSVTITIYFHKNSKIDVKRKIMVLTKPRAKSCIIISFYTIKSQSIHTQLIISDYLMWGSSVSYPRSTCVTINLRLQNYNHDILHLDWPGYWWWNMNSDIVYFSQVILCLLQPSPSRILRITSLQHDHHLNNIFQGLHTLTNGWWFR